MDCTIMVAVHYSNYVDVIKAFMHAERLGDWSLHLSYVAQMPKVLAAAGHFNYAKAAQFGNDDRVTNRLAMAV